MCRIRTNLDTELNINVNQKVDGHQTTTDIVRYTVSYEPSTKEYTRHLLLTWFRTMANLLEICIQIIRAKNEMKYYVCMRFSAVM